MENLQQYADRAYEFLMVYGVQVVMALLTLWIGLIIIGFIVKLIHKTLTHRKVDESLRPFLTSLVSWSLKAMLFISVASMVGIQTTSFVAIIGAAGLAVGLALQGTLANFAGGVLILLFKPIRVGHLIEAQGFIGTVAEIQIFVTRLKTPDNKTVYIPNGILSNGSIINYTELGVIRIDLKIGVSYTADLKVAREALMEVMKAHPLVLDEPAPYVSVGKLADSGVQLEVRPHSHPDNYWTVYFDILEQGKLALDAHKISIPFPQRDVHIYQH